MNSQQPALPPRGQATCTTSDPRGAGSEAVIKGCRICGSGKRFKYLSLGQMPLANRFLRHEDLNLSEPHFPLEVFLCEECGLSQLIEVVPPEVLFKRYLYVSSTSDLVVQHARWLADTTARRFGLGPQDRAVEVASNDGCVLKAFRDLQVRTLGVEPAENIAALARAAGVETLCDFFTSKVAVAIREEGGPASIIIARHVLAHVDALLDFVEGLRLLLADDGVVIIEVPYLVDLLERVEYDTIYDEHLSYFSLTVLLRLFGLFSMKVFDVQRLAIHGGSLLVYLQKEGGAHRTSAIVAELLKMENELHLERPAPYIEFARKVERAGGKLNWTLSRLRATRNRIVGYGAAAKGNILLNYCGIGHAILDYVLDKNPLKHYLYTPGMHIPVLPVDKIKQDQPDYMLILAWNFADEIIAQQAEYRDGGGRFIIPVPEVRII